MDHVKVEDIEEFYRNGTRADNDRLNRLREKAMLILNNVNHPFFHDITYGAKWNRLLTGFLKFIKDELEIRKIPSENITFAIDLKAGLNNHYDHYIRVMNLTNIIFEFKYNRMPQFANEPESNCYINYTLPEMWYNGPLTKIMGLYSNLSIPKPDFETYKNGCRQYLTDNSKMSFFKQFRKYDEDKTDPRYKQKEKITAEGIKEYLLAYGPMFDVNKLKEKLLKDQAGKIYGVWNPKTSSFKRFEITLDEITPVSVLGMQNNHLYLKTKSDTTVLDLYLRWKNTNGICNPMWQIGLKTYKLLKGITRV